MVWFCLPSSLLYDPCFQIVTSLKVYSWYGEWDYQLEVVEGFISCTCTGLVICYHDSFDLLKNRKAVSLRRGSFHTSLKAY